MLKETQGSRVRCESAWQADFYYIGNDVINVGLLAVTVSDERELANWQWRIHSEIDPATEIYNYVRVVCQLVIAAA